MSPLHLTDLQSALGVALNVFVGQDCLNLGPGAGSALLCPDSSNIGHTLRSVQCNTRSPAQSSKFVLALPEKHHALYAACTRKFSKLGVVTRAEFFTDCDPAHGTERINLYACGPEQTNGVLATAQLPESVQLLHVAKDNHLTFMFDAKLAGAPGRCLWDSRATK